MAQFKRLTLLKLTAKCWCRHSAMLTCPSFCVLHPLQKFM